MEATVWGLNRFYHLGYDCEVLPEGAAYWQVAAWRLGRDDRAAEGVKL